MYGIYFYVMDFFFIFYRFQSSKFYGVQTFIALSPPLVMIFPLPQSNPVNTPRLWASNDEVNHIYLFSRVIYFLSQCSKP